VELGQFTSLPRRSKLKATIAGTLKLLASIRVHREHIPLAAKLMDVHDACAVGRPGRSLVVPGVYGVRHLHGVRSISLDHEDTSELAWPR
jgi:hypothetical protein